MKKRSTALLRKTSPSVRSAAVPARPIIDPATFPDLYCVALDGDCLEPLIPHGAAVVLKKSAKIEVGDVVCIWWRPELLGPDAHPAWLKRVTMNVPPWVKQFPYNDHPQS